MNEERLVAQERRLVCAARSLLSMQVGLCSGALRIAHLLDHMGDAYAHRHAVFAAFAAAIPAGLPVGTARLYWTPARLLERDAELAGIEARYRHALLAESFVILRAYKHAAAAPAASHLYLGASENLTLLRSPRLVRVAELP